MTKKELEIAKAACCVGTIWDQYEGTEKFNEMVGKRVQHLIALVRNHLQQEQPKFKVGDLIVSKYNPHFTYKILATNIPNELGKTDYKVEIFTDGKPGLLGKPHNIRLISSDKIEDWGELVQLEKPEVDLEKEIYKLYDGEYHDTEDVARYFYALGLNARKEE